MQLVLGSAQSNLNFELSLVGIHQVLREIWLFEHQFSHWKFWTTSNFCGVSNYFKNCSKNYLTLFSFPSRIQRKSRTGYF